MMSSKAEGMRNSGRVQGAIVSADDEEGDDDGNDEVDDADDKDGEDTDEGEAEMPEGNSRTVERRHRRRLDTMSSTFSSNRS